MEFEFIGKILSPMASSQRPRTAHYVLIEGVNETNDFIKIFVDSSAIKYDLYKKYKIILQEID